MAWWVPLEPPQQLVPLQLPLRVPLELPPLLLVPLPWRGLG